MAGLVKAAWFGKQVTILMSNDKMVTGILTEVTDAYVVLERSGVETQIMGHAVIAVRLASEKEKQQGG